MANEVTLAVNLRLEDTTLGIDLARNISGFQTDFTGNTFATGIQTIGTGSAEQITVPSDLVSTPVLMFVKNLETKDGSTPDSHIKIGYNDGSFRPFIELQPQQWGLVPVNTASVYAQAEGMEAKLEYILIEGVY